MDMRKISKQMNITIAKINIRNTIGKVQISNFGRGQKLNPGLNKCTHPWIIELIHFFVLFLIKFHPDTLLL